MSYPLFQPSIPPKDVSRDQLRACETYDEHENDDIPSTIHHVHFPADIVEADRHNENEETPVKVSQAVQRVITVLTLERSKQTRMPPDHSHELSSS